VPRTLPLAGSQGFTWRRRLILPLQNVALGPS
jgi:hypothetical protein